MRTLALAIVLVAGIYFLANDGTAFFARLNVDPVLVGFAALFGAGIVVAEILRPFLSGLVAPIRFGIVATLAAGGFVAAEFAVDDRMRVYDITDAMAVDEPVTVVVPRSWDGLFRDVAEIGGIPVAVEFDIGVPLVVLTPAEAQRLGIAVETLDYSTRFRLGGRSVMAAKIVLPDVSLGGIRVDRVEGAVLLDPVTETNILGLSFFERLEGTEIRKDKLVLRL